MTQVTTDYKTKEKSKEILEYTELYPLVHIISKN